ncbi:MAG: light-harvesting antenna LH1, alpha subunit [Betaproteobacteria bacterium]|jgi:light-harvesting complex 1 alpha chain
MWRIWLLIDPRRAFVIQGIGLGFLAIMIHLILLSSNKFNWIDGPSSAQVAAHHNAPMPPAQGSAPAQ